MKDMETWDVGLHVLDAISAHIDEMCLEVIRGEWTPPDVMDVPRGVTWWTVPRPAQSITSLRLPRWAR